MRIFAPVAAILLCCSQLWGQTVDFSATAISGCAPLTVQFQDLSSGPVNAWLWNLGKGAGNTSTVQNPSAIYTEPGLYTVTLTINGNITHTKVGFIEVFDKPTPAWSIEKMGVCSPLQVNFTNQTSGNGGDPTTFEWFFGDGGRSTELNPSHSYENAGSYTVTLSATNSHGCVSVITDEVPIVVAGVTAIFEPSETVICQAPATLHFVNSSSGGATLEYDWSFGDGTNSQDQSPSHVFHEPGAYEVTLQATNELGCTGKTKRVVQVGTSTDLDFQLSATKACVDQPIVFTSPTTPNILSRSWNFGNGATSLSATPSLAYEEPGTYVVTLEAQLTGNPCVSLVSKEIIIADPAVPRFASIQTCGNKVTFESTSMHASQLIWDFGDNTTATEEKPQHIYGQPGKYFVRLSGYNELLCPSVLEKELTVYGDPVAALSPDQRQNCELPSLSGCAPFTLTLESKSVSDLPIVAKWKFSDGTQETKPAATKTFSTKGIYEALLTVTNTLGCKDTAKVKIYVADSKPAAKLEFDKKSVCVGEKIHFKDLSTNSNFSCWRLGGQLAGTEKEFDFSFAKPGLYAVSLTSKNDGCASEVTSPDIIEVKNPFVDFSLLKNCADPYTVTLANLSEQYHSIEWDLGDGQKSTDEIVTHTYPLGSYTVRLKANNRDSGCEVTIEKPFVIQDVEAYFEVSNSNPCKFQPVTFHNKSKFAVAQEWLFSDEVLTNDLSPTRSFENPGSYGVRLRVRDSDGCTDDYTLSAAVHVIDITGDFSFSSSSTCETLTTTFQDLSVGQPEITAWHWDFGDGGQSDQRNPTHEFTALGNYSVALTLTNALGSCLLTKNDIVQFTNPVPNFTTIKKEYCVGDAIPFINLSQNASRFRWALGDGKMSDDPSPTVTFSSTGSIDVALTATDGVGCSVTETRTSAIRIRKPVADFEALQTSAECPPLITTFVNRSTADVVSWLWDFGDGQMSSLATATNTYHKPGIFDVSLLVKDAIGCSDTMKVDRLVSVGGPFGTYHYHPFICLDERLEFQAETQNALIHRWDFGDGAVTESDPIIQHVYEKPGKYRPVLLLIDSKGCQVALDDGPELNVYSRPTIDFMVTPEFPFVGEVTLLSAAPTDGLMLVWRWSDQVVTADSVHTEFSQPGNVAIELMATNEQGCSTAITKNIRIQADIVDLPNVFTPGHVDGKNDTFEIPAVDGGSWELAIYNRWGNLVFHTREYQNDWNAESVSAGAYYFRLQNNHRKERQLKGFVHVLK